MEEGEKRRRRQLAVCGNQPQMLTSFEGWCHSQMTSCAGKDTVRLHRVMQTKSTLLLPYKALPDCAPCCPRSQSASFPPASHWLLTSVGSSLLGLSLCRESRVFYCSLPIWEASLELQSELGVSLLCSHRAPGMFYPIFLLITLKWLISAFVLPTERHNTSSPMQQQSPSHVASPNSDVLLSVKRNLGDSKKHGTREKEHETSH